MAPGVGSSRAVINFHDPNTGETITEE
jgi:hypothetical protein